MWFSADEDVTFPIDYVVDGEYVIPDSATVSIRMHDGTLDSTIALDVTTTSTSVAIPGAKNAIAPGLDFENRFLSVSFVHQAKTYQQQHKYSLHPFVPMTGTPDDVRSLMGLDLVELPDKDIDMYRAFIDLKTRTDIDIAADILGGSREALLANEAIVIQAALNLMPSMHLRVAEFMESEDSKFRRYSRIDFRALEAQLAGRQKQLLSELSTTSEVQFSLFVLSTPTDPVTNA